MIVAAQAPLAAPLVAPVAREAAAALEQLTYGAFLSVAVETSETTAMPWDDVYAMATPGRAFDMFTNQAHVLRREGERRPGGSLMLFAGGPAAAALMRESDAAITRCFLADLHDLYPQTRGVIAGATVHRWELGNVYARPGRHRLQAALEGALGAHAQPSPRRRLLRRAGEHGGRRPYRRGGRRARRGNAARTTDHPPTRGPPCLSSTGCSPPSSRRSRRTAATSTRDALTAIVDRLVGAGVAGLVPGGSTGEFTTLTNAERRAVIEMTVGAAAGRVPVVAGTGALSTRETVELSVHAERAGATAVMVVPPFYEALGWRELLAHYTAVAEAISIPIMYYNLPSASGVKLDTDQLRELQRSRASAH